MNKITATTGYMQVIPGQTKAEAPNVVNHYIEWSELNGLYGRILTILEAIGALPDTYAVDGKQVTASEKREAIKSLISEAIFSQDYAGFGATETDQAIVETFDFYNTKR